VNDLICVTGNLGAAYMGLQLLEREKKVFESNTSAKPQLKDYEYILERILKPEAQKNIIETFKEKGIKPTSMIDISDGLSSELLHICKSSDKGCRVYLEKIPVDEQTAKMAEELNIEPSVAALNGGEDYELLFTVPISTLETISQIKGVSIIGHITEASTGAYLVTPSEDEVKLTAQGWNAMRKG
jgi:thiamine-monophosphate kinase